MSDKKISYLDRTFDDYKKSIKEYIAQYYPQLTNTLDDASIGSWIIDIMASVADNLSYHIDKTYAETNLDNATERASVYNIARNNGLKIRGPQPSCCEMEISCVVPTNGVGADTRYMPILKQGTKFSSGSQVFELMGDLDFSKQFNNEGFSDRTIVQNENLNTYTVTKNALAVAGTSKVYRQIIRPSDIKPFMEIILPDKDIISVESVIFKEASTYSNDPSMNEFMIQDEVLDAEHSPYSTEIRRFFEVNSLCEQTRFGDVRDSEGKTFVEEYEYNGKPMYSITKGEKKVLTQKFITEYTDNGYMKIIFGGGTQIGSTVDTSDMDSFAKYQSSKILSNDLLGKLPKSDSCMFVLYRVGGGAASNVAEGTINTISFLNLSFPQNACTPEERDKTNLVMNSLKCTNITPSISGKDAPTVDEVKNTLKYNNGAQERCVTLNDYENRIKLMPSKYGVPYKVSVTEDNNKIMMYLLGIDDNGKLSTALPSAMIQNIQNYLAQYRSISDFVEIKSGRIINVSFEVDLFVNKNYVVSEVMENIVNVIINYMDTNKHELGENIFVGDIDKEISKVDGVINVIETRVYNEYNAKLGYSSTITQQGTKNEIPEQKRLQIDLDSSQYVLNSEFDEMFEIKFPDKDIRITVLQR